jgi:Mrp family chromosome partitioning ATPase
MNATVEALLRPLKTEPESLRLPVQNDTSLDRKLESQGLAPAVSGYDFAGQQVRGLIQQVFFPGWPRPARQVVFSAVDPDTDTAAVCCRVCQSMAQQLPGTVCAVEADLHSLKLEKRMVADCAIGEPFAISSKTGNQLEQNLWLLTSEAFLKNQTAQLSAAWLRPRLSELRREFDYTVIHAPAAGLFSETALLGQLADGVILVLDAHSTRRAAARKARQELLVANVRLLGTVLKERTFPIPERIYRRL